MSQKTKIILICVWIILLVIVGIFLYSFVKSDKDIKDISKISSSEIIDILKINQDIKNYTEKHPDFSIKEKEVLTRESITAGLKDKNFKPMYEGLNLEENRYIKVQLMDMSGSNGYFGVIDCKKNSVVKAFGILLFQASASDIKNGGKTTNSAENQ